MSWVFQPLLPAAADLSAVTPITGDLTVIQAPQTQTAGPLDHVLSAETDGFAVDFRFDAPAFLIRDSEVNTYYDVDSFLSGTYMLDADGLLVESGDNPFFTIASLGMFSATEGTIYFDATTPPTGGVNHDFLWQLDDGTTANRILIFRSNIGRELFISIVVGNVLQAAFNLGAIADSTRLQLTVAWKADDFAVSLDGAAAVVESAGDLPAVTHMRVGAPNTDVSQWDGHIHEIIYAPRRVIDADLPTWQFDGFFGTLAATNNAQTIVSAASLFIEGDLTSAAAAQTLVAQGGEAAAYYIDAVDGDDGDDGLTPATAWETIAPLDAALDVDPKNVMFKGGQTHDCGDISIEVRSGTTLGSYGTGRATLQLNDASVFLYNVSNATLRDVIIVGPGRGVGGFVGVWIGADTGNSVSNNAVLNVDASGCATGVYVSGYDTSQFADILIEDVVAHDNGFTGIDVVPDASALGTSGFTDVTIRRCTSHGNGFHGIRLSVCQTGLIEFCESYQNGDLNNLSVGIVVHDSANVMVQFCESYENVTGGAADGDGFDLDGGCASCIVQYCYAHDNVGAGFLGWVYADPLEPTWDNNTFRFNISENDGSSGVDYGGISFGVSPGETMGTAHVYGNTVYQSLANRAAVTVVSATPTLAFHNNIFVSAGSARLLDLSGFDPVNVDFIGNAYQGSGAILWNAATYTSVADWRTATGQETVAAADTSFIGSAGLADPGNGVTTHGYDPDALTAYRILGGQLVNEGRDLQTEFGIDPGVQDYYGITLAVPYNVGADAQEAASSSLSVTDAVQILSADAVLLIQGSLSATAVAHVLTSDAGLFLQGAVARTDTAQVLTSDANLSIQGAISTTEAAQVLSSAAGVAAGGSLSAIQGVQTLASDGALSLQGSVSATLAAQTLSSTFGLVDVYAKVSWASIEIVDLSYAKVSWAGVTVEQSPPISASAAVVEMPQTLSAAAQLFITGELNAFDQSQNLLSGAGNVIVGVIFNSEQSAQTLSSNAVLPIFGSLTQQALSDTLSGQADLPNTGELNIVQAPQTLLSLVQTVRGTTALEAIFDIDSDLEAIFDIDSEIFAKAA